MCWRKLRGFGAIGKRRLAFVQAGALGRQQSIRYVAKSRGVADIASGLIGFPFGLLCGPADIERVASFCQIEAQAAAISRARARGTPLDPPSPISFTCLPSGTGRPSVDVSNSRFWRCLYTGRRRPSDGPASRVR